MLVGKGEKLHIMYRSFYEKSARRHFVGEVIEVEGAICRLEGYAFIFDDRKGEFTRKADKRTTIIDVAKGVAPFFLLEIPILAILIMFPEISTYLPSKMFGK